MSTETAEAVLSRLAIVMETKTDRALAAALGVSPTTFSSWKSRNSPPYEKCVDIAQEHGVSLDWLLTGRGEMLLSGEVIEPCSPISPREQALLEMFKTLSDEDQREIFRGAEEKKRLMELERRVEELSSALADGKKLA